MKQYSYSFSTIYLLSKAHIFNKSSSFPRMVLLTIQWFLLLALTSASISPDEYVVEFHNDKVSPQEANQYLSKFAPVRDIEESVPLGHFEVLRTRKLEYLCYIPYVNVTDTLSKQSDLSRGVVSDDATLVKAVDALSTSFSLDSCIFSNGLAGGYWTYGYCFGDKVVQYHESHDYMKTGKRKPENPNFIFILGRFKGSRFSKTTLENQAREGLFEKLNPMDFTLNDDTINPFNHKNTHSFQKFIQHTVELGGICKETNEPRSIDIIYKCHTMDPFSPVQILDVNEIKTCEYQMVIHVGLLCYIEEFQPSSSKDEVVEINCKEISTNVKDNIEETQEVTIEEFLTNLVETPQLEREYFPITRDYKLTLSEYSLFPLGSEFFLADSLKKISSASTYFNERYVLVFSNDYEDINDLKKKVKLMFQTSLERFSILTLAIFEPPFMLTWKDSFLVWFEIYDFHGQFISLVQIRRDSEDENFEISIKMVEDPANMLDQVGNQIRPMHGVFGGHLNFEYYSPLSSFKDHLTEAAGDKEEGMDNTRQNLGSNPELGTGESEGQNQNEQQQEDEIAAYEEKREAEDELIGDVERKEEEKNVIDYLQEKIEASEDEEEDDEEESGLNQEQQAQEGDKRDEKEGTERSKKESDIESEVKEQQSETEVKENAGEIHDEL